MPQLTLDRLRRYAIARTLFAPTTLTRALHKLGFLQADPRLEIEECFFVNYGFLPRPRYELMHPRTASEREWNAATTKLAAPVLRFVHERGSVHPREVEAHFALGPVTNYWGGTSSATTHLLDRMHYRGLVRVVRRDSGVRVYSARPQPTIPRGTRERQSRLDQLVDLVVQTYAPLPHFSLNQLVSRLSLAAPQWHADLTTALARAKQRLPHAEVAGTEWYWPLDENPSSARHVRDERVRLLTPFDPLVWDRRRFELLWGWAYRFEAYTPPAKRKLGYYALPLLWRDHVIGWGNLSQKNGELEADFGFVKEHHGDRAFTRELDDEVARMRRFLGPR